MIEITDKTKCAGCYACMNICPVNSIRLQPDAEGFCYPVVDQENCTNCGLCSCVCPVQNQSSMPEQTIKAYAAINLDEQERFNSSSGGIFSLLAKLVIAKDGVVFGAAFDKNWKLIHIGVTQENHISALCGSKYVQSNVGMAFREVKQYLSEGRLVLFVGTPCQVFGLHNYLGNEKYDNLLLVDLICHGVPSPGVWERYFEELTGAGADVETVNFRYKLHGWKDLYFHAKLKKEGQEICQSAGKNPYLAGFLKNLTLRSSCYSCAFKTLEHACDLTLADFWGVKHILPEYYDNKGCSLLLSRSEKAERFVEEMKSYARIQQVELLQAVAHNSALTQSSVLPAERETFFAAYKQGVAVTPLLAKLSSETVLQKVVILAKRAFRWAKRILKR